MLPEALSAGPPRKWNRTPHEPHPKEAVPTEERFVMQVKIEYCAPCGYLPQATALASEIKNKYGVDAELVKGVKGIFDVYVDGKPVFSRYEEKRFPEPKDIFDRIGSAHGA
jgi:selenoprotein W-related protein